MKVLKIGAVWCAGCKVMRPRWAEIEQENGWLETEYADADMQPEVCKKYGVQDLPCFIFLDKNGSELERMKGEVEKEVLVAKIEEYRER